MGSGFEHAALAVFTTLAPMGAASFIALAYAFATERSTMTPPGASTR